MVNNDELTNSTSLTVRTGKNVTTLTVALVRRNWNLWKAVTFAFLERPRRQFVHVHLFYLPSSRTLVIIAPRFYRPCAMVYRPTMLRSNRVSLQCFIQIFPFSEKRGNFILIALVYLINWRWHHFECNGN